VHFVGLFFVFIIENARSKKQNIISHHLLENEMSLTCYGNDLKSRL